MTTTVAGGAEGAARQARLVAAMARLRTRGIPLERTLLIVGGVLLPLGLMLILLGWMGASNTPRLFEQIPYLISGGLLGLALVFAGGFVYFAYWMTRLVNDGREQAARLDGFLSRLEDTLLSMAAEPAAPPAPTVSATRSVRRVRTTVGQFVATPSGTQYHRPDCSVVAARDDVRRVAAGEGGSTPCKICQPEAVDVANPSQI